MEEPKGLRPTPKKYLSCWLPLAEKQQQQQPIMGSSTQLCIPSTLRKAAFWACTKIEIRTPKLGRSCVLSFQVAIQPRYPRKKKAHLSHNQNRYHIQNSPPRTMSRTKKGACTLFWLALSLTNTSSTRALIMAHLSLAKKGKTSQVGHC